MPDAWFDALVVAGVAILLWRPATGGPAAGVVPPGGAAGGSGGGVLPGAGPGWRRVVAAGLVLGTSATVAQVGEALLLPAVIYLLAARGGRRRAIRQAALLRAGLAL